MEIAMFLFIVSVIVYAVAKHYEPEIDENADVYKARLLKRLARARQRAANDRHFAAVKQH